MRFPLASLLVLASLPAFAQGVESHWYLDVHRFTPTLTGHFNDISGGNPIDVDLQNDLALSKSKTKIGFGLAYDHFRSEADFLNGQVGPSGCLPMNADPQCPQLHSDRHTERTDAAIAEGLYATAGALAVLGGVLWLVWPAPRGGSSARLLHPIVWTADRTTGAAITGSW